MQEGEEGLLVFVDVLLHEIGHQAQAYERLRSVLHLVLRPQVLYRLVQVAVVVGGGLVWCVVACGWWWLCVVGSSCFVWLVVAVIDNNNQSSNIFI